MKSNFIFAIALFSVFFISSAQARVNPYEELRRIELPEADPALCRKACEKIQCTSWRYVKPGIQGDKAVCYLKRNIPQKAQARVASQMKVQQAALKIPIAHVWEYLKNFGDEPKRYAAYSYILTGRDGSDKYAELVKRIQGSTLPAARAVEEKIFQPEELNIFLIPAINTKGSAYKPDYEVSKTLLAVLGARSKFSFDRPGPFIITLYQSISSIPRNTKEIDMLYVDLTNVNKGAVAELIRTYKQAVLEEKLDGMEKLKSLRLSILNLAFMTEESLGFAKAAYGAVYPVLFGGDNK